MRFFSKQYSPFMAVLVATLMVLVVFATLQFSWVGQISRGERDRMSTNLATSATRFREDFDREMARIYLSLQIDASTLRDKNWQRYTQRYDHWMASAPYPQLIDQVYLVEILENGKPRLSVYRPDKRLFEFINWPDSMTNLQRQFVLAYRTNGSAMPAPFGPIVDSPTAVLIPAAQGWSLTEDKTSFDPDTALVFDDTLFSNRPRRCWQCARTSTALQFAYTLVTLNTSFISEQFIPSLAKHYFSTNDEYNVAVVRRDDPKSIIYRSNSAFVPDKDHSDATEQLMSLDIDGFSKLLLDDSRLSPDNQNNDQVVIGIVRLNAKELNEKGVGKAKEESLWQLVVTHRVGSLDTVVRDLQIRNMVISFSTLLLLVASLVVLAISTRRAQRLARQQIEFVASVSHELRTPLAVIRSAGENLADGIVGNPQRTRQYGDLIRREGQRLTDIIEQMLAFASSQSNRRYQLCPLSVDEMVREVVAGHQYLPEATSITIEIDIAPDIPLVLAEPAALKRALGNLVTNAIKYSGSSSWVGISAHADDAHNTVHISVQDHGIGIPAEELSLVLEPFYRSRNVIASSISGSGLGLSLVKNVVQGMRGRLLVESIPGKGSVFTIVLRTASASAEHHPELAPLQDVQV